MDVDRNGVISYAEYIKMHGLMYFALIGTSDSEETMLEAAHVDWKIGECDSCLGQYLRA